MTDLHGSAAYYYNNKEQPIILHDHQRLIVGLCPSCGRVLLLINSGDSWPMASCFDCDKACPTTELKDSSRYEKGRRVYPIVKGGDAGGGRAYQLLGPR